MSYSIEQMFLQTYQAKLKEAEDAHISVLSSFPLSPEEYHDKLGYIRAIREMREELANLKKAYFPDN